MAYTPYSNYIISPFPFNWYLVRDLYFALNFRVFNNALLLELLASYKGIIIVDEEFRNREKRCFNF